MPPLPSSDSIRHSPTKSPGASKAGGDGSGAVGGGNGGQERGFGELVRSACQRMYRGQGNQARGPHKAPRRLSESSGAVNAGHEAQAVHLDDGPLRLVFGEGDLDLALREQTGLAVSIADESLNCVALGTGKALEYEKQLRHVRDYDS